MLEREEQDLLVYKALTNALRMFWQKNQSGYKKDLERLTPAKFVKATVNKKVVEAALEKALDLVEDFAVSVDWKFAPRLEPITSCVINNGEERKNLEKLRKFYPIKALELSEKIFPKKVEKDDQSRSLEYKKLWEGFLSEYKELPGERVAHLQSLVYLLQKYTWCVPGVTKSGYTKVSFYDQSRITAALASCFYVLGKEGKEVKEKFLVIEGDISGIQKFIYNPAFNGQEVQDGVARRLRGRSFYLNLLLKTITDYIVEKLELYSVNVLWATGGHFLIIAPNTSFMKETMNWL